MKKMFCTIACFLFAVSSFAQTVDIPTNYSLEKAEDYAQYEDEIIASVDWLIAVPLSEQQNKREKVQKFLFTWIVGAPNVTIELNDKIVSFMGTSPHALIIFMGGWTRQSLQSGTDSKLEGNIAGIEAVIEYYQKNKASIEKDKKIEKYITMQEKGTLRDFVKKKLKIEE
ncbi:MAG: hypothetical protein PF481_10455 [Bacteroidales bacterium]|jgi:hypothetical protein|nr:hypothetical protein [Bacteroidales bacterium]